MENSPQTTQCESRNQQRCQMVCEGWGEGSNVDRRGNCWVFGWDKGWCGQRLDWISFKRVKKNESQFFWSFEKNLYSLLLFEDLKLSCNIDSFNVFRWIHLNTDEDETPCENFLKATVTSESKTYRASEFNSWLITLKNHFFPIRLAVSQWEYVLVNDKHLRISWSRFLISLPYWLHEPRTDYDECFILF